MNADFPRNLRLLTDHFRSVAEVCRRLDLNRSQFNKYLSGRSTPSRHVLKRLCDFFGVEEYEILLPCREFERIVRLRPAGAPPPAPAAAPRPYVAGVEQLVRRSRGDLPEYEGYYFEYSYSMTREGLVLRSLMHLRSDDGVCSYLRMENMALAERREPRVKCKYLGMAFFLNDRIFLLDYDSLTGNEISQTVLYPNYRHRMTRLAGLKLGVSSGRRREPLCVRVVLEFLGRRVSVKKALRNCGLYDPDSPAISDDVKAVIGSRGKDDGRQFRLIAEP